MHHYTAKKGVLTPCTPRSPTDQRCLVCPWAEDCPVQAYGKAAGCGVAAPSDYDGWSKDAAAVDV